MKKFLLVAVAAFLFAAPAFAQTSILDIAPEVEAKCTHITRSMALELRLNEPEYIKLKELNRERMVKTDALLQQYSQSSPALQEKMHEMEIAYEQKMASFLTPNQLHAYDNYKQTPVQVNFVAITRE
ncbi:hypothetical protein GCM10023188_33090 [Pontibacter saemangeumensis]|uniref:Uncharacterized protein n=1 Tax=Pontibacter saemangeumensis TaxID=1084525 RepID=A0ABP8LYQ9_9BACT